MANTIRIDSKATYLLIDNNEIVGYVAEDGFMNAFPNEGKYKTLEQSMKAKPKYLKIDYNRDDLNDKN